MAKKLKNKENVRAGCGGNSDNSHRKKPCA